VRPFCKNADTIFVIRNGTIMEKGSHDQLMELGGYYRELYEQQNPETLRTPLPLVNAAYENLILQGRHMI
jgi:hypothetical protein